MSRFILPRRAIAPSPIGHIAACVDLRQRFGRRYKVRLEEVHQAEGREFREDVAAWLMVIPCAGGEIFPHGGNTLAAYLRAGPRARRLAHLPGARVWTEGTDGTTVIFDAADFEAVAQIMRPRRRRGWNASPAQLEAMRGRAEHARKSLTQKRRERLESTIGRRLDIQGLPAFAAEAVHAN